jgi:crotonobetainyl-CoA:carnitine CoA-transferase CaiB-like acyl-CoA transferase
MAKSGQSHPLIKTLWTSFAARDGDFVLAEVADAWPGICRAVGVAELAAEERFRSVGRRLKNREPLLEILRARFAQWTVGECVHRLRAEGVLAAPVQNYEQVAADADVRANGYVREIDLPGKGPIDTIGPFLHFSATAPAVRCGAPELAAHTSEILAELGYDAAEIDRLRSDGAIA